MIPDISKVSSQLQNCLQETEEIPADFTHLFRQNFFQIDQTVLPDVLKLADVSFSFRWSRRLFFKFVLFFTEQGIRRVADQARAASTDSSKIREPAAFAPSRRKHRTRP